MRPVGDGPAPSAERVRVSNLNYIHLDVSLDGSRFRLEALRTTPRLESAPTLEITVRELPSRRVVPIRVWDTGTFDLEVPLDPALARTLIDDAVLRAEREEERRVAAGKGDPRTLADLRAQHDRAVSALQQDYFHENRTGLFEIQGLYRSSAEGFWNGTVESDPVSFEIVYEGDYLQKHGSP